MEQNELYYDLKNINHSNRMVESIKEMLSMQQLTDCSLIAENKHLRAHRVILASASEYLLTAFNALPDATENEIATIVLDDVRFDDLFNVIKFIYNGKITLSEDDLVRFMDVGNMLKIRGVIEMSIDINKELTTACQKLSSNEAGTSKETKQYHGEGNKNALNEEIASSTQLPMRTRKRQYTNDAQNGFDDDLSLATQQKRTRNRRVYQHIPLLNATEKEEVMHCSFCERSFHNRSTLSNHERFCEINPNRRLSTCPICSKIVKPGSMTFHKKTQHNYVPQSRKRQSKSNDGASASSFKIKIPSGFRKSRRFADKKAFIEDSIAHEMEQIHKGPSTTTQTNDCDNDQFNASNGPEQNHFDATEEATYC